MPCLPCHHQGKATITTSVLAAGGGQYEAPWHGKAYIWEGLGHGLAVFTVYVLDIWGSGREKPWLVSAPKTAFLAPGTLVAGWLGMKLGK